MTEVGLSGPTKLLISRENELGLRGSPRGGPSEGRAGHQRDQCESSDKRLHHFSPYLWITVRDVLQQRRPTPSALYSPKEIGSACSQRNRLGATLGPAISLDLMNKPTIEGLILWFAQRPSRRNVRASFILLRQLSSLLGLVRRR
jgi:hypothetical protein